MNSIIQKQNVSSEREILIARYTQVERQSKEKYYNEKYRHIFPKLNEKTRRALFQEKIIVD